MVMGLLQGKVALITGGNSGIGLATAREFHAQGAKVVLSGRDREKLGMVTRQLVTDILAIPVDVTRSGDLDELMSRAHATFGKLDILFVNAGIFKGAAIETIDEKTFDEVMNTNFKGAYFTIQKALPFLNDNASIILNGSINAHMSIPHSSLYTASKAALHSLTRTLTTELTDRGIRINTISLGPTDTSIFRSEEDSQEVVQERKQSLAQRMPFKRIGSPEEVAKVALFLASDASSFVVGSEITADGGLMRNTVWL